MSDEHQDKYFFDDGSVKWDDMPHPEDLWAENEYELVGLWVRMFSVLNQVSNNITAFTKKIPMPMPSAQSKALGQLVASGEGRLENWVEHAKDYLPEWFDWELYENKMYIPYEPKGD